jgi:hypothetical protein
LNRVAILIVDLLVHVVTWCLGLEDPLENTRTVALDVFLTGIGHDKHREQFQNHFDVLALWQHKRRLVLWMPNLQSANQFAESAVLLELANCRGVLVENISGELSERCYDFVH